MQKTWVWAAALVTAAACFAQPSPVSAADYAFTGVATPSRGRAAALLTALFYYDPAYAAEAATGKAKPGEGVTHLSSVPPGAAQQSAERGKLLEFAGSLIYEGGFFPKEIYQLLGYKDVKTAKVARLARQLDSASGKAPAPWEVAGRVGRSGMSGASDHWAMAPGDDGDPGLSTPGTLAYLPALAVVYANYPADGCEAAAQLAILKDDDVRAAPVARSALSLLVAVLLAEGHDKDAWLRTAAADSRDPDTERDLRAVRAKDWRYLRGEECAMGRLERAVYIWYKGDNYAAIMQEGTQKLRSRESLAYLSSLAAATYGMEGLSDQVVARGSSDRQLLELIRELHDLATSEAVLRVEPEGGS